MEDDHREVVPEDLVFEILKEVPAKSLLRFRCVSKLWCSIIDNSNFIHSHQTRSYSRLGDTDLLLTEEGCHRHMFIDLLLGRQVLVDVSLYSFSIKEQSAPTLIDKKRVTLHHGQAHLCYVNGLISLGNWIYNPSTRQTILLPPVVMDGNILPTYYLGFDHSTKLYKVLAITCLKQPYSYNVLTLGTNSWRNVGGPVLTLPQRGERKKMVYSNIANGVIFILTFTIGNTLHCLYLPESLRLHAFEVGDEKCRAIAFPEDFLSMLGFNFHLLLVNDRPAVMIIGLERMTIWILEDYAKQIWKKEHIQYPRPWQHPRETTIPLGTIHERKILFSSDLERSYNYNQIESVFYYDMECKTSITIPKEVSVPIQFWPCEAMVTKPVETLFKLKE